MDGGIVFNKNKKILSEEIISFRIYINTVNVGVVLVF